MTTGNWMWVAIPVVVLAVLLLMAGVTFGFVYVLLRAFAQGSGLSVLAERFAARQPPAGQSFLRQTAKIGAVRYRNCVTLVVGAGGLFLDVGTLVGKVGPVLVPWGEVRAARAVRLYWEPAVELTIGASAVATVTVYESTFGAMKSFLTPELVRAARE